MKAMRTHLRLSLESLLARSRESSLSRRTCTRGMRLGEGKSQNASAYHRPPKMMKGSCLLSHKFQFQK